ncbi:alpha/beta fold hydrolase [Humibacter ginsenosidimutans]|uniref:alpha/beta fold hydrolase n=1 Tax=Humibacter ginsenosidimutans TaxID=2599293 RepID=UPI001FED6274|nr:alpha/beta hydrolase [Humibacter ginsenosidimutans]
MTNERQIEVGHTRTVRVWDSGAGGGQATAPVVIWHHGTPQTGRILAPIARAATRRGIRVISCARAGYQGTTSLEGRRVADAAADVVAVAAALGVERYATMGASGGGPHALACAALDPEHVVAAVTFAGIAPYVDEPWWFEGMASPDGLRSAHEGGREARRRHAETSDFDESSFVDADWQALAGDWEALGADAGRAGAEARANGGVPWGEIDDDVAFVEDWGIELGQIECPAFIVQGGRDRVIPPAHSTAILSALPAGELWLRPRDGHVSVLGALPIALEWMLAAGRERAR